MGETRERGRRDAQAAGFPTRPRRTRSTRPRWYGWRVSHHSLGGSRLLIEGHGQPAERIRSTLGRAHDSGSGYPLGGWGVGQEPQAVGRVAPGAGVDDSRSAPLRRSDLGAPGRRMTNWRDGSIDFEQRGVEFPDRWCDQRDKHRDHQVLPRRGGHATARGVELRQLIDRVVQTYSKAGEDHGYFATDEDAEIFEHELTWMLLHQVFSFNSPVWFNVGTPRQQVQRVFHPLRRRLDGVHSRLVQGGGPDLPGRLRRGRQPVPHPARPRSCFPPAARRPGR